MACAGEHPFDPCPAFIEPVSSQRVSEEQERIEAAAVLNAINLFGDETLHKALDDIGCPREPARMPHEQEESK